METTLTIVTERVDDIPLLVGQMDHMGLEALLDQHFPTHANWQGLSLGQVTTGWLAHILSQADHRMNYVEQWAGKRLRMLSGLFDKPVRALDFSDDRLSLILKAFSADADWADFEAALNGHLLRIYDLSAECVRLDATTASGYFAVTEQGLFQFGHSKDHRPDLPQVKIMLSTLDPLALPLATQIVSGQRADDPLYIPAIEQVHQSLGRRGLLFVGDCKMAAFDTRAYIAASGDYYLCPLSKTHLSSEVLAGYLDRLWHGQETLQAVSRMDANGKKAQIAEGFEHFETLVTSDAEAPLVWTERHLVVRSLAQAEAACKALDARLERALEALVALNKRGRGKKRLREVAQAREAVDEVLSRYRVADLIEIQYQEAVTESPVRRYRDRPARLEIERTVTLTATVNEAALEAAKKRLGWRVYVTNQPGEALPLEAAVCAYRHQYRIEHPIGRLKGQPLSLSPLYLQREDHVKGLVRLLSIALRVLMLLEHQVRRGLADSGEALVGLDVAHAKRAIARPTAERLLKAFSDITLTLIEESDRRLVHVTVLSELQERILALLDLSPKLYLEVGTHFSQPP